jgi:hypothetical protein
LNEQLKNLRHEIVSRHFFDGGYVQQYVVHGTLVTGGEAFRMPLCMNVTVRDGRIARLEEYLDSAPPQTAADRLIPLVRVATSPTERQQALTDRTMRPAQPPPVPRLR